MFSDMKLSLFSSKNSTWELLTVICRNLFQAGIIGEKIPVCVLEKTAL